MREWPITQAGFYRGDGGDEESRERSAAYSKADGRPDYERKHGKSHYVQLHRHQNIVGKDGDGCQREKKL